MRPYRWPIWLADGGMRREEEKWYPDVYICWWVLNATLLMADLAGRWEKNEKGRGDGRAAPGLTS